MSTSPAWRWPRRRPADAGEVLGYTSQARFLINCGLAQSMEQAAWPSARWRQKLVLEHEMGELFKVMGLVRGAPWEAMGFHAAATAATALIHRAP
jgi:SAM-dependent MidA family methyltransferase